MPENAKQTVTYRDYNSELSTVQFYVTPLDGAEVDWDAAETARNAVISAIGDITLGIKAQDAFVQQNVHSLLPASGAAAQREVKWLVQYHDTLTLKRFTMEIPCADTSKLDPNDRANAHIGDSDVVDAFITAFQANAITPDGNSPIVDEITLVGRNV